MINILVIDYGMGNLKSVQRGLESVGASVSVSSDPEKLLLADKLVLPGVGSFKYGMDGLKKSNVIEPLKEFVKSGKPLLGICLGMQMMMDSSDEHGNHLGLGLISGEVTEIPKMETNKQVRKIPHIGWSKLLYPKEQNDWSNSYLSSTKEKKYFYFVHSFMAVPTKSTNLLAQCEYEGLRVTAAIQNDNVTGFQFHPEKSGEIGLNILREFVNS